MDNERVINITHYVNPHMFWFKWKSKCVKTDLLLWEKKFLSYLAKVQSPSYQPDLEEIVAVFDTRFNYWIKAKCDHISIKDGRKQYYLWGMDVGIPLQVEDTNIRQLPRHMKEEIHGTVCFAGLVNIVPAQKIYNLEKLETEIRYSKDWSSVAVETMRKLIQDAHETIFVHTKSSTNDQLFGNMIFTTQSGIRIRADKILLDLDQATVLPSSDFFKTLDIISTNMMPRWLTNDSEFDNFLISHVKWSRLQENETNDLEANQNLTKKSEIDYDAQCVSKKCLAWQENNKIYRNQEEINLQDLSINDKISDVKKSINDTPLIKAGALRRRCLKKYQSTIPPPPFEENSLVLTDFSCVNIKLKSKEVDPKHNSRTISDEYKDDSYRNAVKVLMDRRYNKRKDFNSKFSESSSKGKCIPTDQVEEFNDVTFTQSNYNERNLLKAIDNRHTSSKFIDKCNKTNKEVCVMNSYMKLKADTSNRRYMKKKDEDLVFPAGFDMRNFTKTKGNDSKTTKNQSKNMETSIPIGKNLNSLNSVSHGITDLKLTQRPNKNYNGYDVIRNDVTPLNFPQTKVLNNFDEAW